MFPVCPAVGYGTRAPWRVVSVPVAVLPVRAVDNKVVRTASAVYMRAVVRYIVQAVRIPAVWVAIRTAFLRERLPLPVEGVVAGLPERKESVVPAAAVGTSASVRPAVEVRKRVVVH